MALRQDVSTVKETVGLGARELTTMPMLLGVAGVLSSGAVISSYMGLFGERSRLVRLAALGVFSAAMVGYAGLGAAGFSGRMREGVQAFTGTLGLLAFADLVRDLLSGGMPALEVSAENYPEGEGRVLGQQTADAAFTPMDNGAQSEDTLSMMGVDVRDLGQYSPLDSHHQDIGHAPPVWMAESVPTVAQKTMVADAQSITPTGKSDDPFAMWVMPSIMNNSAGFSGHGVIQNFGSEYGRKGNMVQGSEGYGSIIGQ